MNDFVLSTYQTLMTNLSTLPAEIAAAQGDLTTAKTELAKIEDEIKYIEKTAPANGNNADERKLNTALFLKNNAHYQALLRDQVNHESAIGRLTVDEKHFTNQFTAVGFQARLHSGLMNYLAASGATVPVDFNIQGVTQQQTNGHATGHANGHATAEDAAAIGL